MCTLQIETSSIPSACNDGSLWRHFSCMITLIALISCALIDLSPGERIYIFLTIILIIWHRNCHEVIKESCFVFSSSLSSAPSEGHFWGRGGIVVNVFHCGLTGTGARTGAGRPGHPPSPMHTHHFSESPDVHPHISASFSDPGPWVGPNPMRSGSYSLMVPHL